MTKVDWRRKYTWRTAMRLWWYNNVARLHFRLFVYPGLNRDYMREKGKPLPFKVPGRIRRADWEWAGDTARKHAATRPEVR
jgi:hypothetical protein